MVNRGSLVALIGLVSAGAAHAQLDRVTVGGDARALAMGGAGVAAGMNNRFNPGALAFRNGLRFQVPSIGLRATGALGKVGNYDSVGKFVSGDGADREDAARDVIRNFGSSDSEFGANIAGGIGLGPIDFQINALASGRLTPNASLKAWAAGGASGNPPSGASADVSAVGFAIPSVGFGMRLPLGDLPLMGALRKIDFGVGVRAKYVRGIYSRYTATVNDALGNVTTAPGAELGGADSIEESSFGADLGAMAHTKTEGFNLSAGIVALNFVKPKISFPAQGGGTFDPFRQTITAGVALNRGGLTVVGDLVDVTGDQELRAGAEQRLGPLALRGGYSSRRGTTYGVGLFGFDIAFGKGQPLELVRNIRF